MNPGTSYGAKRLTVRVRTEYSGGPSVVEIVDDERMKVIAEVRAPSDTPLKLTLQWGRITFEGSAP